MKAVKQIMILVGAVLYADSWVWKKGRYSCPVITCGKHTAGAGDCAACRGDACQSEWGDSEPGTEGISGFL